MKWRKTIFLLFWILSLIGISFFGGPVSYGLFWGLTLLLVVSLLYLLFVFWQFRIYQEIGSRTIVCKEPMPYYFSLQNETLLSFASLRISMFDGLSKVLDVAENKEYQLLPEEKYVYETKLICFYRGEYEVGVKEIVITDFLRLFQLRYKNPGTIKALVYPRLLHLPSISGLEDEISALAREHYLEQARMDVVTRDYTPGDALKQIHFKASAKEGTLKTRLKVGERKSRVKLIFDTQRFSQSPEEYLPLENQILEATLAIGEVLAAANIAYEAHFAGAGMSQGSHSANQIFVGGIRDFDALYEAVSKVEFAGQQSIEILLREQCKSTEEQTLIVVAHEVSREALGWLQKCVLDNGRVFLYLITDEEDIYSKWNSDRMKIHLIPTDGKLEELL